MSSTAIFQFLETGIWALLVTGGLFLLYVLAMRMKRQMQKGQVQASSAAFDRVEVRRLNSNEVHIQLDLPPNWCGPITMHLHSPEGSVKIYDEAQASGSIAFTVELASGTRALEIIGPGQKLYRSLETS